jgi:nucleotide-binding universal stress UspA family protein
VVPFAAQFAYELSGTLALVSVVPKAGQIVVAEGIAAPHTEEETKRLQREAEIYLGVVAAQFDSRQVLGKTVRFGDPPVEIAAEAEERGAAVVVMATHGRAGLMRTLLGSVAGQVVHTGKTPVMLVRPPMLRGAEQPVVHARTALAT